uniref:Uncharacterized protein n=1 Tax=Caenorhabditis japonica TaxID=281687 RepID=A0A8R1IDD3_CAEJA
MGLSVSLRLSTSSYKIHQFPNFVSQFHGSGLWFTTPPTENGETLPAAPDASSAPAPPAVEQPSGMQVFLATVYSFVTSFFASLVPDHPMPMDLN